MNTISIPISSTATSTDVTLPTTFLYDTTKLIVNTDNVSVSGVPISLKIRWGDNSVDETYTTDFFTDNNINVLNLIKNGNNFSIIKEYSHRFSTSQTALTQRLTAQMLFKYFTGATCLFKLPIEITNPSLTNKNGDISILSINANFNDEKLVTLYSEKERSVTEIILS